jgi:orotidine-5'-phosphate decarboxylase
MSCKELFEQILTKKSYLCVGLDTDFARLPKHLLELEDPIFEFNRQIIEATADLCVAYKPNTAFYEAQGSKGWHALERTVAAISSEHLIIADAKRGDIGNTSSMYARAFFEQMNCDAVTVAPYMGADSVQPFLEFEGKWVVLLGLTSNVGSQDFQLGTQDGSTQPLYEKVLRTAQTWGTPDNLMFVVGATHPEKFREIRRIAPDNFLLVPGVGAQGGDLQAVSENGWNAHGGLLVNASRSIIYASAGEDFAEKARAEALKLQQEMARFLETVL